MVHTKPPDGTTFGRLLKNLLPAVISGDQSGAGPDWLRGQTDEKPADTGLTSACQRRAEPSPPGIFDSAQERSPRPADTGACDPRTVWTPCACPRHQEPPMSVSRPRNAASLRRTTPDRIADPLSPAPCADAAVSVSGDMPIETPDAGHQEPASALLLSRNRVCRSTPQRGWTRCR